jgi:sugar lactone lactonase YvrE
MLSQIRRVIRLGIITMMLAMFGLSLSAQEQAVFDGHFVLPEAGIYPEGIAYSQALNAFFVGSAVDGTILRGDLTTGEVTVFIPSGRDGNTSVTGMKVDSAGHLWVCGAETGKVFVYDASTGDLIRVYQVPPALVKVAGLFTAGQEVPANLLNDIAIAANGDVFIADTYSDLIYRIPSDTGELEVWLRETGGGFINGIAVTPDDRYLLIALTEAGGLRRVKIATREISQVWLEGGILLPDGLLFDRDHTDILYAANFDAENNATIARVTFTSEDYSEGVVEAAFIEDDTFAIATTLAQAGNHLLVVNSQMFAYFDPDLEPVRPWVISNVRVPATGDEGG